MNYIYHRIPDNMIGNILYPLNQLKDISLDSYKTAFSKYDDRPYLPNRVIYPLECFWNDVLFFLPINPVLHIEFIKKYGYGKIKASYFEIPAEKIPSEQSCIYLHSKSDQGNYLKEDFVIYDPACVNNYNYLTQANKDYLQDALSKKPKLFFPWNHIPHILYKGNLDVADLRILSVGGDCPREGIYTDFKPTTR